MEISNLRGKIDKIDDQISKLYIQRMELSREIGQIKNNKGSLIESTKREREIINRVTKNMPNDIKFYGKQVFETLFSTSKAYQSHFINLKSEFKQKLNNAISQKTAFPVDATVACQGIEGAYSGIASSKLFAIADIMYFKDFDGVFNAVEKGLCEYGVLPIENSSVGSVNAVYDLMKKHNFYIVRSVKMRIRHYLLSKSGVKLEDIKEVFSHEQAIGQCSNYLKQLGDIKITVCDNTAIASKLVAESDRTDIACISSNECAGIYGLSVLGFDIQNNNSNYTRFIAISKNLEIFDNSDKISIMANLYHETGSLNSVLNKFSALGLNLTKLESRPLADTPFEFAFYFDFDARIENLEVQNLLAELEHICERFVFLGSYLEII